MDCDNKRSKPPSTRPLLYQQVQEQSSLCDVIVKVGLWEKRFHWCVLVASPFFEAIHRNNFLEKQTGIVELTKWTTSVVEMALLFLYGQKPKVREENADMLLDIAEFLLIPELKVACIDFLKKTTVTLENCARLLELSSVYEFILEKCDSFIKGKLPDVLKQEGMLNSTTESVKVMLTDPTLRYVPVQSWFNFLIPWVHKASERQNVFVDLFKMLDFSECDSDFMNNTVAQEPLVIQVKDDVADTLATGLDDHKDTVLIFKNDEYESLECLNMRTMLWYRLDISTDKNDEEVHQFRYDKLKSVKNSSSSCIYKLKDGYRSFSILTHDLSNAESSVSKVVMSPNNDGDDVEDKPAGRSDFPHYSLANDTLAAVSNKTIIRKATEDARKVSHIDALSPYFVQRAMFGGGTTLDDMVVLAMLQQRMRGGGNDTSMKTSTLYLGEVNETVTKMHAVLTVKNHSIAKICRGDNGIVAMLSSDDDNLFIFDESAGELECVRLKTDFGIDMGYHDRSLAASRDGFVLYNDKTVVCLSKLSGAALNTNYNVKEITWEREDSSYESKYCFDGDRWIRYKHKRYYRQEESCGYVSHHQLTTTEDTALLHWESIPVPSDTGNGHKFCQQGVFAISLPKGSTKCHLECPHCKMAKDGQSRTTTARHVLYDDTDYMYDSSDVEDSYDVDDYYTYDSDDDYNYYSD